jgi:carbonic anhydrase
MTKISDHQPRIVSSEAALERLMSGNRRFVDSKMNQPKQMHKRRMQLVDGQDPFAVILGCSDSRIPPEIIFDEAKSLHGDLIENTAKINAKRVSETIRYSLPILSKAVQSERLKVMPAYYSLDTGKVDLL